MAPLFDSHAERNAFMAAYREIYAAWVDRHVDDSPFDPHSAGSDYPEHHLTVDSTPEQDADLDARVDELIRTWPERWAQIQAGKARTLESQDD